VATHKFSLKILKAKKYSFLMKKSNDYLLQLPPLQQLLVAFGLLVCLSLAIFFFEPLLKSVSYQPLPLSLKPAADIFFFNSGSVQLGQWIKGFALIFCNASYSCPHD
jgi:hypothetical protein